MSNYTHTKEDLEFDRETRDKFNLEQRGFIEPKAPLPMYRCTCSKDGMEMTFHKDYCQLNLTAGKL